ncbi:hypothetical protein [Thermococcus sp. 21S7]|uniref:hypothetical protein n=1 Tax=Thermococcus sp. 21S7 TaxID=1638221 RepID=UPI00143A851D|nr:hypothetical protein [Thermococcus sp. 21S7]NJE62525.1 hypothetical protein [Thermococcus sp. 21S7]
MGTNGWLVRVHLRRLGKVLIVLSAISLAYSRLSPSTTPAMTLALFILIAAFPLAAVTFRNAVIELKNPVSRLDYAISVLIAFSIALSIPLLFALPSRNFGNAVLLVLSAVPAALLFAVLGMGIKASLVPPLFFVLTSVHLMGSGRWFPALWNPLASSYYGVGPSALTLAIYTLAYLHAVKRKEWRS